MAPSSPKDLGAKAVCMISVREQSRSHADRIIESGGLHCARDEKLSITKCPVIHLM